MIAQGSRYLGLHTNNYAEYMGLLDLLKWATRRRRGLDIYCDSKLVVNQVSGDWKMNSEELSTSQESSVCHDGTWKAHAAPHHGHDGDPGNEYRGYALQQALDKEFARRKNGKEE